jgi:hypothetical protein
MWEIWAQYQGYVWDGDIDYPDEFSIQDKQQEYVNLQVARTAATGPEALAVIDQMLIDLITDDTALEGQVTVAALPSAADIQEETKPTTAPTAPVVESQAPTNTAGTDAANGYGYATNNQA